MWFDILKNEILFCEQSHCLTNYWNKELADKIINFSNQGDMYFHKTTKEDLDKIKNDRKLLPSYNKYDANTEITAIWTQKNSIWQGYNAPTIGLITNEKPFNIGGEYWGFREAIDFDNLLIPKYGGRTFLSDLRADAMVLRNWIKRKTNFPELSQYLEMVNQQSYVTRRWFEDFLPDLIKLVPNPNKEPNKEPEIISIWDEDDE